MKNLLKIIGLVSSLGLMVISCSSDDNGGNKDYLNGVPKGEVVPIGERFVTLTGYDEGSTSSSLMATSQTNSQKWWKYIYGEIEYNCEGENDVEEIEEAGYYYAFFPNGKMYYKDGINGTPFAHNDWEWADSSKSKVRITDEWGDSQVFEFTELNANAVVYASYQSQQGCSLLSWEQLGNPVYEDEDSGNNGSDIEYPYISEVGLFIFDGDDPLSDGEPVYSFTNNKDVFLNPAFSCQMGIEQYEDILEGDIAGAWGIELHSNNIDILTDNSCFNESFEITATDFESSMGNWYVELFPPDESPYKILYYEDGDIRLYRDIITENWDGSQGSISINPSSSFYTDPNYGVLPKKVSFTFNNVRVGYYDENGIKKALRIHGIIEITKHD